MSKDALKRTLDEAEWIWVKPHLERDAVILISNHLDLFQVANLMADDRSEQVKDWIAKGQITKPSHEQIELWNKTPNKRFMSVVVQPYVLIQERFEN